MEDESKKPLLMSTPALELVYVGINTTRGPLADVRVRQAINHAIDVPRIIERLIGGRGTRAAGVIPPALAGYDSARKPYAFDTTKARALLARGRLPERHRRRAVGRHGPIYLRIAETMQAYLNAVGHSHEDRPARVAPPRAPRHARAQTDLILKDWYADYPDAENFLYPLLHSANKGVGGNVSFYSNPAFDSLVTASRRELDETKRIRAVPSGRLARFQRRADDLPVLLR